MDHNTNDHLRAQAGTACYGAVLKKQRVLIVTLVMVATTLLSPLWIVSYSVDNYMITAVLWSLRMYGSYSYFEFNGPGALLTMVFFVGLPNFIFAIFVVRLVVGKTSTMKVALSGIISATWYDILMLVAYLPYILTLPPYLYLPPFPIPVPIQLVIGLVLAWLYRSKVDDSIWPDEVEQMSPEPKKADWLSA